QSPSNSLHLSLGERPRLPFTARIERAHSDRARSASKKGTWPLSPFFSILLKSFGPIGQQTRLRIFIENLLRALPFFVSGQGGEILLLERLVWRRNQRVVQDRFNRCGGRAGRNR